MSAAGGPRDYYSFIRSILDDRLDEHPAWPANVFKLECEGYGLYQNTTGKVLQELLDAGIIGRVEVEIRTVERPFITRPGVGPDDIEPDILDATREFDEFLFQSGYFANLAAYVALCKVQNELRRRVQIDVLPEGPRPHLLHYPGRDPDGLVMLPSEYVPVEVYNGKDYLGVRSEKFRQLRDLSSFESVTNEVGEREWVENDALNSHPMLINRRSDSAIKQLVRKLNGMVVDTDCILACEDSHPDIDDTIELFNLDRIVHLLPSLETTDGIVLDGNEYRRRTSATGDDGALRPPSKMADAADELPSEYMMRIRGGLQLQYVNSLYRQFDDSTMRVASLVVQTAYHELLREGGWDMQIALDDGWDRMRRRYPRVKSPVQRKDVILDEARAMLNGLREERIIAEQNGDLYARKATHPQPSLSF